MFGLIRRGFQSLIHSNRYMASTDEKMLQFTEAHLRKSRRVLLIPQKSNQGRSWWASELRLKSSEDLQKLWYVLLKEKNQIFSDNEVKKKFIGSIGRQGRLGHVKHSMARLLTVLSERRKVREQYRKQLEDEYVNQKRVEYDQRLLEEENSNSTLLPQITPQLLRSKWNYLKGGIDNHQYIRDAIKRQKKIKVFRTHIGLNANYEGQRYFKRYSKNKAAKIIDVFSSTVHSQIERKTKISQVITIKLNEQQEEILKSHVKNWKMLNIKQKRIMLGFINARRSREVRKEFLSEVQLIGQKIAYDHMQGRTQNSSL